MNSEQLTSFNLHLAKQCRRLSRPSNFRFKKSKLNYSSKSTSSTSSQLNLDELEDLELDEDIENSDSLSSENNLIYDSKFYDDKELKTAKGFINDDPNLFSTKLDSRKRSNPNILKRTAANLRERKRMQSINSAFDYLRVNLPTLPYEKRLSKVDTLKLAISYISFLNELVTTGRNPAENAIIKRNQAKLRKTVIQYHRNKDGVPLAKHILSWNFEDNPFQNGNLVLAKTWIPENPNSLKSKTSTDKIDNSIKNNSLTDTNSSTNSTVSGYSSFDGNGSDESILQSNFIDSSIVDNSSNNVVLKNSLPTSSAASLPMNCFPNQSESTYTPNANLNEPNNPIIDNSSNLFNLNNNETSFDNQNLKNRTDLVHNSDNINCINNNACALAANSSNPIYSTYLPDQMQSKPIYTNSSETIYTSHTCQNSCIQQFGNPQDYHHFKSSTNQLDASSFSQSTNHLQMNNHPQFISNRLLY